MVGSINPAMIRSNVDLPEPDDPTMLTKHSSPNVSRLICSTGSVLPLNMCESESISMTTRPRMLPILN